MKRLPIISFVIVLLIISLFSCKTVTESNAKTDNLGLKAKPKYDYEQLAPNVPLDEYLMERVWILAGCKFNDEFKIFSANLTTSRIIFLPGNKFEATSGINNYYGSWSVAKRLNKFKYKCILKIKKTENVDKSNTIGIPFDKSFNQSLEEVFIIEVDQYSIRFYSEKNDYLLHFVRS